jgi:beta-carotene 3-hydroxylase
VASVLRGALVATAAFAAMEPVAYGAHRWVMHGPGRALHDSHHRPGLEGRERLEANDLYPLLFAAATVTGMAAGTHRGREQGHHPAVVLAAGAGVTAYGLAYAFVHDVYIHRRLGSVRSVPGLERLRRAHACHHRDGGEPYGMLFPILPAGRLPAAPAPRRDQPDDEVRTVAVAG